MKAVYQDILNRAYNTLFHPSVQWHRILTPGYHMWRYPAPASEKIEHVEHDFKTPYRDSKYYVRHDEPNQIKYTHVTFTDPLNENVQQKLVRMQLLAKDQVNNQEAVTKATQEYEKKYGIPVTQKVYSNQVGGGDALQDFFDGEDIREVMASYVREQWVEIKQDSLLDLNCTNLDMDYHPNINYKVGFNINENDPLFRQLIVDLHTVVKNMAEDPKKDGYISFFRGDPSYWHVLDNSFSPDSIKLIQSAVRDEVSQIDTKALQKHQNSTEYHIEQKVQVPIQNKYYS